MTDSIDPVAYGELKAKVANLEKTVEKISDQMDELMKMANQSKGGLWMLVGIGGTLGAIVAFVIDHVFRR